MVRRIGQRPSLFALPLLLPKVTGGGRRFARRFIVLALAVALALTALASSAGAASDLRANTAAAGGEPVHVLELPAERVDWRLPRPDGLVINPPRSGCAPGVLDSIARSTARRLVYVSCDPTTLARDVRRLGRRWRLESVRAFDLFPQTAHVETVATLSREPRA